MIRKGRLFTPGPTQLLPSAQLAMAAATMHHRTAEFRALYTRVLADLKIFVGTKNDVVMFTASGTGAMEAAVANLTSPGDKVFRNWHIGARADGLAFCSIPINSRKSADKNERGDRARVSGPNERLPAPGR